MPTEEKITEFWMFEDARHNINAFCIYLFYSNTCKDVCFGAWESKQEVIDILNERFNSIKSDVDISDKYNELLINSGKDIEGYLPYKVFKNKEDLVTFIEKYFK